MSKFNRGFTLLETLVVFLIVALVSGLLLQGFTYVAKAQARASYHIAKQQKRVLQQHWLRSSLSGLIVEEKDATLHGIVGNEHGFEGLSVAALNRPVAVPTHIAWYLKNDNQQVTLLYKESYLKQDWTIKQWNAVSAQFAYLTQSGEWHNQWPLASIDEEPLPRAIRLTWLQEDVRHEWLFNLPADWKSLKQFTDE